MRLSSVSVSAVPVGKKLVYRGETNSPKIHLEFKEAAVRLILEGQPAAEVVTDPSTGVNLLDFIIRVAGSPLFSSCSRIALIRTVASG